MNRRNVLKSLAACLLFPFVRRKQQGYVVRKWETQEFPLMSIPANGELQWGDSDSDGFRSYTDGNHLITESPSGTTTFQTIE